MAIKITHDKRTILTNNDYRRFRTRVYDRCGGLCEGCARYLQFGEMELHHIYGRGGGKRDDIPCKVLGLCSHCHEQSVIKRREPVNADAAST